MFSKLKWIVRKSCWPVSPAGTRAILGHDMVTVFSYCWFLPGREQKPKFTQEIKRGLFIGCISENPRRDHETEPHGGQEPGFHNQVLSQDSLPCIAFSLWIFFLLFSLYIGFSGKGSHRHFQSLYFHSSSKSRNWRTLQMLVPNAGERESLIQR